MGKEKDQATVDFVRNSHFSMETAAVGDTVMEKIRNRNLSISAVKVWLYLARNRDIDSGKLHGSLVDQISKYWDISTRTVRRGLADLIDAGLYEPPQRLKDKVTGVLLPKRKKGE